MNLRSVLSWAPSFWGRARTVFRDKRLYGTRTVAHGPKAGRQLSTERKIMLGVAAL